MRRVAGRGRDVLLPNPESVFKPGDPMAAIISPRGREWIEKHFIPLDPKEKSRKESL
jgi:hypothetical protein